MTQRLNVSGSVVGEQTAVPEAGSLALDALLGWMAELGLELVGIGQWGPRLPRILPATDDAPSRERIEASRAKWASDRFPHAQPWPCKPSHVTAINAKEVAGPTRLLESLEGKTWHPRRLPAVCMAASAARRLDATADRDTATLLGLRGYENHHAVGEYFKTVPRLVKRGDEHWRALGVWPWAAFDEVTPADWWCHHSALVALQTAHDDAGGGIDLAQRVAAAREVAAVLDSHTALEVRAHAEARRRWGSRWATMDACEIHRRVADEKQLLACRPASSSVARL